MADDSSTWPQPTLSSPSVLTCLLTRVVHEEFSDRFSSLNRMLKTLVRCRRLLLKRQNPAIPAPLSPVTTDEMQTAFISCVKLSQIRDYALEIEQLTHHSPVDTSSPLRALASFLKDNRVLRVGGRLENSSMPFDEKHPVILDSRCHLARLIINWAHLRALQGGFRLTYAHFVGGRVRIKSQLRQCVICVRAAARHMNQLMAPSQPRVSWELSIGSPVVEVGPKKFGAITL